LRLVAALAAAAAALAVASGVRADTAPMRFGVADDWPKWHACGDAWWQSATDLGLQELRLTVQWNDAQPAYIPFQENLQAAIDCALLSNVVPVLAIYPLHPGAIGGNPAAQAQFASFVSLVGTAFPQVTNFIVGNEPNVNRFWQPQYVGGRDAAATDYEHTLAASYDALKAVRPDAVVWGPAISSRGNDDPYASSNPSHSPVWFIKEMGDAYRASGRTKPLFDEFDMHPYPPVQDTAPFTRSFQWPQAGAADLARIKQALWDAFHGTAQPLPAEYAGGRSAAVGLPIDLDEAGEQTTVVGHAAAYVHAPESVQPISEATQARRYVDLARIGECDPDVKAILWFPLIDDSGLSDGFQSGLLYADLAHKPSYDALKTEIATSQGQCSGIPQRWVHTRAVSGAAVVPALTSNRIAVTAAEDATYSASLVPAPGTRRPAAATVALASGVVRAYRRPPITLPSGIRPGTYRVRVVVAAATNPDRTTTLLSRPFTVGAKKRKK
jgi:hypothetical protein